MKIIPWIVRHAGGVLNRYQMGKDGRTPYRRMKGRGFKREVVEFGEYVMYMRLESEGKDKGETRWSEGVFVGVRDESGEILVGTREGVVKARTFRRYWTEGERWRKEEIEEMVGVPWEMIPGRGEIEARPRVELEQDEDERRMDGGRTQGGNKEEV